MTNDEFIWPAGVSFETMSSDVELCLSKSPNLAPLCANPKFRLDTFITRICQEYNVHPIWILTCLQRERSLLRGVDALPRDFDFACGFVGSDAPGTVNSAWNGLVNQIWRCARHTGWFAGQGPSAAYGWNSSLWPSQARWYPGTRTLDVPIQGDKPHTCASLAEYVQLLYTDHLQVLKDNEDICEAYVRKFF